VKRSGGFKFLQAAALNESIQRVQGKDFPACRIEQFSHIFLAYPKAASTNTGNDLEIRLLRWLTRHTQGPEVLHTRDFITGCAVVFRDLGFNNNLGLYSLGMMKSGA
jgi:hypothetical protein